MRRAPETGRLIVVAVVVAGCGDGNSGSSGRTDEGAASGSSALAAICAEGSPESLNPFLSPDQLTADLAPLLFTSLVRYGADGNIQPHLATDWSWAQDNRQLRLKIRSDVTWHDGQAVSAEDVAWTLRTAANPDYGAWSGPDLATLESATAADSGTVELRFHSPFAAGMEPFVSIPILPRHLLDGLDPEAFTRAPYHRQPIGSGPYRLLGRQRDGSIAFERWPGFPTSLGEPKLGRLIFRPVSEDVTLTAEMRTGGADVCLTGAELAGPLKAARGVQVVPLEPPAIQVIVLDNRRPLFQDVRLRRALSAAMVRKDIAAVASPIARPARNLLPDSSPWLDEQYGQPDADSTLADSLLASAGWPSRGPDGIRRNGAGRPLRFTLVGPPQLRTTLTAVQGQVGRLGIDMRLQFMEWAAYVRAIRDPDSRPEAMAFAFVPERILHPDYSVNYRSDSPMNFASYANSATDSVLNGLVVATEQVELRRLYGALQHRLAEDVPVIYLVYVPRLLAVGPRLEGVRPAVSSPLQFVTEWRLAAERQ